MIQFDIDTFNKYKIDRFSWGEYEHTTKGWTVIQHNLLNVDEAFLQELLLRIERIKLGERDIYF